MTYSSSSKESLDSDPFKGKIHEDYYQQEKEDALILYKEANDKTSEPKKEESEDDVAFDTGEESGNIDQGFIADTNSDLNGLSGYKKFAKISVLDKITGKSKELSIQIGQSEIFGNMEIFAQKCFKNEPPSIYNNVLLKIIEHKVDEEHKEIFYGWMVSDNPSISNLSHNVYEVFAVDCVNSITQSVTKDTPIKKSNGGASSKIKQSPTKKK